MRRSWHRPRPVGLPPSREQLDRLAAWVDYLDVDLDLAQATLRLPLEELPPLPGAVELRPAPAPVDFADAAVAEPVSVVPASSRPLRGAYARRAAANK